jgi:hypothetical protein
VEGVAKRRIERICVAGKGARGGGEVLLESCLVHAVAAELASRLPGPGAGKRAREESEARRMRALLLENKEEEKEIRKIRKCGSLMSLRNKSRDSTLYVNILLAIDIPLSLPTYFFLSNRRYFKTY